MRLRVGFLVSLAAGVLAAPPAAAPAVLSCGEVVTTDVTLQRSLTGCTTGLIVGADNVVVDLNGYAIAGVGPQSGGSGVEAIGRSGVVVRNGRISGFDSGVLMAFASSGVAEGLTITNTNRGISIGGINPTSFIRRNVITASLNGIVVFGGVATISGNRMFGILDGGIPGNPSSPRGVGVSCNRASAGTLIEGNSVAASSIGIFLFLCAADVIDNSTNANRGPGIVRFESPGRTVGNSANVNRGTGIDLFDSHGTILDNVAYANGGDGIRIQDSIPTHGEFYTVGGNTANANAGFGIRVTIAGVGDAGGDQAHANGAGDCLGIVC